MGNLLYDRVRGIIESARVGAARSVNTAQVVANWLVGREIVEEEQKGAKLRVIERLSGRLTAEFGRGYSVRSLRYSRQFFIDYSGFLGSRPIRSPVVSELGSFQEKTVDAIRQPVAAESWRPGLLNNNLSRSADDAGA